MPLGLGSSIYLLISSRSRLWCAVLLSPALMPEARCKRICSVPFGNSCGKSTLDVVCHYCPLKSGLHATANIAALKTTGFLFISFCFFIWQFSLIKLFCSFCMQLFWAIPACSVNIKAPLPQRLTTLASSYLSAQSFSIGGHPSAFQSGEAN